MSKSLSQLYVHIVFHVNLVSKTYIPNELLPILHAYLATVCNNHNSPAIIVGGTYDHVHILCRMSKNIALAELLQELKTNSSKWIKTKSHEYGTILSKFSWQKGYGAFSVSSSQTENVKSYISNQKDHHQKLTFKEEYILFLNKHNLEYDEKYLWN